MIRFFLDLILGVRWPRDGHTHSSYFSSVRKVKL
jgi:hypothetical protein